MTNLKNENGIVSDTMTIMKLIYNTDAITPPLTGIGRYALNLGQALKQHQMIEDIRLFAGNRWLGDFSETLQKNAWLSRLRDHVPFKYLALQAYHHLRCKHFDRLTGDMFDHVFHSPNFILMPFDGVSVATFHDLSFVHFAETQPKYRLKFLDKAIPKTLAQAQHIITPSTYVKNEVANYYGFSSKNITVTPLAADNHFKPRSAKDCELTLKTYGLSYKRFILGVATQEPRKNLLRLLQAYDNLNDRLKKTFPLLLVGGRGWKDSLIQRLINSLEKKGVVKCLGFVNDQQLQQLYASAVLTTLPSLYEGFGLPIIESMASGTPVLSSNHSAMQEVSGGHAILANPEDVDDIQQQLHRALEDDQWRQNATQRGLEHAQSFSWSRCAELTVNAYSRHL